MGSTVNDANVLLEKAEKSLKTSIFKRTPDYNSAIEHYTNAALILRKVKSLDRAAEIYQKVAELNLKIGSYFQCAKNYELASMLYKELQQFQQSAELALQAGEFLQRSGAMDSATYVYARAAKALEHHLPVRAAEFYERAADSCSVEEKYNEAADYCNSGSRIFVRLRQLHDAERLLRLHITYCQRGNSSTSTGFACGALDDASVYRLIARAVLVLILIKLSESDEVAAGKVYAEAVQKWKFHETEEGSLTSNLISAFEQRDGEAVTRLLRMPCLRNLDLAYTELTKEVDRVFKDELNVHKDDFAWQSRSPEASERSKPESNPATRAEDDAQSDPADDEDIC